MYIVRYAYMSPIYFNIPYICVHMYVYMYAYIALLCIALFDVFKCQYS